MRMMPGYGGRLAWTFVPVLVLGFVSTISLPSHAGWLIYRAPAFEGKVIDAETGQPIEGVIIEAIYKKVIYSLVGADQWPIKVKQTVTNAEGRFRFSPYTTIISPFATTGGGVWFTLYKTGYASIKREHSSGGCVFEPASGRKAVRGVVLGRQAVREDQSLPWGCVAPKAYGEGGHLSK